MVFGAVQLGRYQLCLLIAVVASVTLHELGHALSALAFGDPTAKQAGRLTINPWKVSPFGAVILPALLIFIGSFPVAFAATPVTPSRMRNPRLHSMLCSLAGPAVNLVLIGASIGVLHRNGANYVLLNKENWPVLYLFAYALGYINVILAVFNLIPIPPLDGSAVVERLMPREWWPGWLRVRQYGMGILILVVFAAPNFLGSIFHPCLNLWLRGWAPGVRFV